MAFQLAVRENTFQIEEAVRRKGFRCGAHRGAWTRNNFPISLEGR